jgi:hypothetical protein
MNRTAFLLLIQKDEAGGGVQLQKDLPPPHSITSSGRFRLTLLQPEQA